MVDINSIDEDLQIFEIMMNRKVDEGVEKLKSTIIQNEYALRHDLHKAISGFASLMRKKYGNGMKDVEK